MAKKAVRIEGSLAEEFEVLDVVFPPEAMFTGYAIQNEDGTLEQAPEVPPKGEHYFDNTAMVTMYSMVTGADLHSFADGARHMTNVALVGPTGAGKTSFIKELCARLGIPLFTAEADEDPVSKLVGQPWLKDGSMSLSEGPLYRAVKLAEEYPGLPVMFLFNEATQCQGLMKFANFLDVEGSMALPDGTLLRRPPNLFFVITGNSDGGGDASGNYAGERAQSAAFWRRFVQIRIPQLTLVQETHILHHQTGIPLGVATVMSALASSVRILFEQGGLKNTLTLSQLLWWGELTQRFAAFRSLSANKSTLEHGLDAVLLNGISNPEEVEAIRRTLRNLLEDPQPQTLDFWGIRKKLWVLGLTNSGLQLHSPEVFVGFGDSPVWRLRRRWFFCKA